VDISLTLIITN